jgi:hypothetical protein
MLDTLMGNTQLDDMEEELLNHHAPDDDIPPPLPVNAVHEDAAWEALMIDTDGPLIDEVLYSYTGPSVVRLFRIVSWNP